MDVRHLRYFVVLSEELHFRRAAERLHMAQPPLSQRIKELEREVGVELFHRRKTGVEITEAGALLLEHAREVLEKVAGAEEAMHRIRPGARGEIRTALPPDTDPTMIAKLVDTYERLSPEGLVSIRELHTDEQVKLLHDGELDVAVVRHPVSTVGLESSQLVSRPVGVILRRDDPLASFDELRLNALSGQPLVLFQRYMASAVYDEILTTCRDAGFLPPSIRHARNRDFAYGLVMANRGVYLQARPWAPPPSELVWRPLLGGPLAWKTSALWKRSRRTASTDFLVEAVLAGLEASGHLQVE